MRSFSFFPGALPSLHVGERREVSIHLPSIAFVPMSQYPSGGAIQAYVEGGVLRFFWSGHTSSRTCCPLRAPSHQHFASLSKWT